MSPVRGAAAKIGQYALVVWVAATVNFALPHLAPGDPVTYFYVGPLQGLSEVQTAQIRASYGLDRSVPEQYAAFWAGLLSGDLGISVQHNRPVTEVLLDRLPWTVVLVGLGLVAWLLHVTLCDWKMMSEMSSRGSRIFALVHGDGRSSAFRYTGLVTLREPVIASLLGVVFPVALAGLGAYLWLGWRHVDRSARGLCPRCGYDMSRAGAAAAACPECGWKRGDAT